MLVEYIEVLPSLLRGIVEEFFWRYKISIPKVEVSCLKNLIFVLEDYVRYPYMEALLNLLEKYNNVMMIPIQKLQEFNVKYSVFNS